jgi:hypothetical protein
MSNPNEITHAYSAHYTIEVVLELGEATDIKTAREMAESLSAYDVVCEGAATMTLESVERA